MNGLVCKSRRVLFREKEQLNDEFSHLITDDSPVPDFSGRKQIETVKLKDESSYLVVNYSHLPNFSGHCTQGTAVSDTVESSQQILHCGNDSAGKPDQGDLSPETLTVYRSCTSLCSVWSSQTLGAHCQHEICGNKKKTWSQDHVCGMNASLSPRTETRF